MSDKRRDITQTVHPLLAEVCFASLPVFLSEMAAPCMQRPMVRTFCTFRREHSYRVCVCMLKMLFTVTVPTSASRSWLLLLLVLHCKAVKPEEFSAACAENWAALFLT